MSTFSVLILQILIVFLEIANNCRSFPKLSFYPTFLSTDETFEILLFGNVLDGITILGYFFLKILMKLAGYKFDEFKVFSGYPTEMRPK